MLDLLWLIGRANLVLATAIFLVLLLRGPVRRWFGARVAYALWLTPPLAAAVCFAPLREQHVFVPAQDLPPVAASAPVFAAGQPLDVTPLIVWSWIVGATIFLAVLAFRQLRFTRALGALAPRADLGARVFSAQSCKHGPAVIGVLRPRIITPADFEHRFSDEQRRIVLAHERAHMAHGDPLVNAIAALLQCVNWFNPLVHVGVRALRLDQELAADAAVLAAAENVRRDYAEAILRAQIPDFAAPLGCAWPSTSIKSLKERIAMLKRSPPTRAQTLVGASIIVIGSVAACAAAWSAQPTRVVVTQAPTHAVEKHTTTRVETTTTTDDSDLVGAPDDTADVTDVADDSEIFSEDERREIERTGQLTDEQQQRIDDRVERALERQQAALERAQEAMQRSAAQVEIAHRAERYQASPEMRAEIHALSAAAARLSAMAQADAARTQAQQAEMEATHEEIQRHADRVRELAEQMREAHDAAADAADASQQD